MNGNRNSDRRKNGNGGMGETNPTMMDTMATDRTYVINASAGTGKTTRLLQDVLYDLLARSGGTNEAAQSLRSSLVITFTEAAAAEMRRKLEANLRFAIDYANANERCGEELSLSDTEYKIGGDDGKLAAAILADCAKARSVFTRALSDLPAAQISTIDALAKHIVDRNAELLPGVEPGQQILSDEAMRHDLQRQSMDALFERWYGEMDPRHDDFLDLLEQFGGARGDGRLRDLMFRLRDTALTKPNRLEWLRSLSAPYRFTIQADKPIYGLDEGLDRRIDSYVSAFERVYPKLMEQVGHIGSKYGSQYPDTNFPEDNHFLRSLARLSDLPQRMREETWNNLYALFRDEGERLDDGLYHAITTTCGKTTASLKDVFKGKINTKNPDVPPLNAAIGAVQKPLRGMLSLFAFGLSGTNRMNRIIEHRLDVLVSLIEDLDGAYRARKRDLRLADFSDIADWAMQVMDERRHPDAVARIRDQWRYIYVDESQDDNALQNEFIRRISRNADKLTMVGDVKQSIYGFRDASPEAFRRICSQVSDAHTSQLWVNYRSKPEIIGFVNAVFDGLMTQDMGKVDYRSERLRMRDDGVARDDSYDAGAVEFLLRRKSSDSDDDNAYRDESDTIQGRMRSAAPQMHVDMIVRRIKELHAEGYAYGDIAVLSRGATYFGDLAERLLLKDVPVEVKGVGDFYRKPEIVIALNWLRAIDNVHRDIPMVAVLRTVGFTDDDLARLRLQSKGGLYDQIRTAAHDRHKQKGETTHPVAPQWLTDALLNKCQAFLKLLDDLRGFSSDHPLDELLWHLYTVTDLFDYVGHLPDGKQRKANLGTLCAKARLYEDTQRHGLRSFLDAVEAWTKDGTTGEEASTVPTKDAVHIMTIHKSKGLQWPVVIVMNAGSNLLSKVKSAPVVVMESRHGDYGVAGMNFASTRHELRLATFQYEDLMASYRRKSVEEELRLLYVALTRPKEKLIIAADASGVPQTPYLAIDKILPNMAVTSTHTICGGRLAVDPAFMVGTGNYLAWIFGGLIAWNQTVKSDSADSGDDVEDEKDKLKVLEEWRRISDGGMPQVIGIPQNPADTDPLTSYPGMKVTVSFHTDRPEPPTRMNERTAGYAYTNKRMDVTAGLPMADTAGLLRVPASVNASGARYWLAAVTNAVDSDEDVSADVAADNVIEDNRDTHVWRRDDFDLPAFMTEGRSPGAASASPSPAEVGTGAHNVLELFDWRNAGTLEDCRTGLVAAIDKLASSRLVSPATVATLRDGTMLDALLWFVSGGVSGVGEKHPLADRIRRNPNCLFREEPFAMLIDANELSVLQDAAVSHDADVDGALSAEEVVVRGIIDGFLVDDDTKSIILFDYKTDRIQHGESLEDWAARLADDYRQQQALYARALEQRYPGYTVTERWLVGLAGHRLIDVSHR